MLRSAIDRLQDVHSSSVSFVSRFDLAYNAAYALTWMKMIENNLDKLTVDDLQEWASEKIFERGKSYLRRVSGLSQAADGTLAAWVTGSERYATSVHIGAGGTLTSFCTCPYDWGLSCKHAVAVVLAAAEHVKQGKAIPVLDEASKLARSLADDEEDDGEAYYEDDEDGVDEPVTKHRRQKQPSFQELQNILQGWSKDKLVTWLAEQAGRDPELGQSILEAHQLDSGQVDKLVRSLRKEIQRLATEPAWSHPWYDDAQSPDYSHLQRQLRPCSKEGITMRCWSWAKNFGKGPWLKSSRRTMRAKPPWQLPSAWQWCSKPCRTRRCRPPSS
ncbi:SWIM zinc finger family protein [Pseudogulbenkiania subflava]|uniref:SWIM-type domain-containing protein n=1 Tax=Pseudogulbenkiania subflava DSM 22618 TaxID=1123014 RepID=A0A1Y6CHN6_9NEIS|nr:hypothetical protein [Pseudogulbenkiania subflava]SMF53793.1 hypothetical protein SAMN02745746_03829 [Pseudogulbenkiania subflava DSM 22618]